MNYEQAKDNNSTRKSNPLCRTARFSTSRISASEENVSTRSSKGSRAILSRTKVILSIVNASNDKQQQLEILALNF